MLVVERNNPLLNHYNPVLILGWRANLDISPCTEPHAVATYIAKYASKAEKPSLAFGEVMMTIARRVEEDTSARIVFQKMLSRILTERDYSAQEVCHQLLLCKMVSASREFVSLCLLENRQRRIRGQEDGEQDTEALEESDMRDAYEQRHEQYINLSLYEWYKDYRRVGRRISKRKHSAIVTLWPPYHPGPEGSDAADNWSRAKLLLHHPHRATADLKNPAETWEAAYQRCLLDHPEGHKDTLPLRPAREHGTRQDTQDEEWSDPEEEEEEQEREDWQVYAGIAPGLAGHDMDGPAFGFRLIDAEEDWHALGGRIGGEELSVRGAFIDAAKRSVGPADHHPRARQHCQSEPHTIPGAQQGVPTCSSRTSWPHCQTFPAQH